MKDVSYIWDVEISQLNFIAQLAQGESLTEISVLLVLDLTQAHDMWNVFDAMDKFLKGKMKRNSATQVNCGIIGMKYDLYEVSNIFSVPFSRISVYSLRLSLGTLFREKSGHLQNDETLRHCY